MTPEGTRLTTALRELRTRTGLSLAGLAERTAYSKSSWERYLNGKAMPPRQAVRDLCRLAREPDGRLLALWEIAESEWSGRAARPAPASAGPGPSRSPRPPRPEDAAQPAGDARSSAGRGRLAAVVVSVCALTVGGVASALLLLPHRQGEPGPPTSAPSAPGPRCRGDACEGQDPMHMFCGAGPDTLATHRTATGARMELRYSDRCRASWARMWGTHIGDRLEMTADGPTRRAKVADEVDAESYVYTVMTATRPGAVVRACFRPAAADGERECVDARVRPSATPRTPSPR
ncbi:DUF2690 domain-containing protein [Streptomyces sp. NPDC093586]|uniref:helix-turn-helix domain-containing protein n=1 Tax=Streptomyces sp. NPDC093586 TaxID=3366042 RepID=UPI0037FFC554